jgi:uncharacterized protein (TIGR02118 family)
MIKLVYCITRKPGMTDEAFFQYWKHVHGPIGARIPGLRRLVQSHRLNVAGDARLADYDGMAELWFDDASALLQARQSPEWRAAAEDEANFIDQSKVAYFLSERWAASLHRAADVHLMSIGYAEPEVN